MEKTDALTVLAALAHETRLDIYRHLIAAGPAGEAAGQIGEHLGLPPPTLAFHLKELRNARLVAFTRHGRSLVYRAVYPTMNALLAYLTETCCRGDPAACFPPATPDPTRMETMTHRPYHVLFLCTGNSARSILAEALLRHLGGERFVSHSAGSFPKGQVHPMSLRLLEEQRLPTDGLRSKSWDEFATPGAPPIDFVFTVCDQAAGEVCPIWPGNPITAHWGIPDPAAVEGSDGERMLAFRQAFATLERRLRIFTSLPMAQLDRIALTRRLDEMGREPADAQEGA